MNSLALERSKQLLKALTLAAMISGLIPTFVFAQSSQITDYSGSASPSSSTARLNGSIIQSTNYGNSSGMRMMRSQAAPALSGNGNTSLFSNDALTSFKTGASGNTSNYGNSATPNFGSSSASTTFGAPTQQAPAVTDISANSSQPQQPQQQQSHFDVDKAMRLGAAVMHDFNRFVSANRQPAYTFNGASQMTNSLFNRPDVQATLPPPSSPFLNGSAGTSFLPNAGNLFNVGRPLTRNEINLLSNYDVDVVIDKSGSMQTQDCPGGLSRWDFCREQLLNLTNQAGSAFRSGITVALFSSDYRIFDNVNFSAVPQIFAANFPDGGTYLSNPLKELFTRYFTQRDRNMTNQSATRPLLIEIITDGDPSDKGQLIRTIREATEKMRSSQEVNIQILQIGHDNEGSKILNELATRLVPEDGAQYNIVNVEPFQVVLNEGLARSLVSVASAHQSN